MRRKPLVDFCTNEWQHTQENNGRSSPEEKLQSTHINFEDWTRSLARDGRQGRLRSLMATAAFLLFTWVLVSIIIMAFYTAEDTSVVVQQTSERTPTPGHLFGTNRRPRFQGVRQLAKLNSALLPGGTRTSPDGLGRRLIFIGDIHGCLDDLTRLLAKVGYDHTTDHIVTTGDMVNKGPASGAVLDFLRSQGASCVRGNHDDRIVSKATQDLDGAALLDERVTSGDPELRLALSLTSEQLSYLQSCPLVLQVGNVPLHGNMVVVHGGLVPSQTLEDQEPLAVMNMRIIHPVSHMPSREHAQDGYVPWAELWEQYQSGLTTDPTLPGQRKTMLDAYLGTTVVYGHDAKRDLQIRKHSKGLDSGCAAGRHLTALVVSGKPDQEIIQVECARSAQV